MAANYWASSQRLRWQTTKAALSQTRQALEESEAILVSHYALPDRRLLSVFFKDQLHRLATKLKLLRQQPLATAQVYLRRFYTRVEIRRTNPYLVLTTALYLACKMEECPLHIKLVAAEARALWPEFIAADIAKIGECEFWLISEMACQMIVHHPYRTLAELKDRLGLSPDEVALAASVVNDHYATDAPLLFPPHVVAVTAIFLALVLKPGTQGSGSLGAGVGGGGGGGGVGSGTFAGVAGLAKSGASATAAMENAFQGTPQEKVQFLVKWLAEGTVDIKGMIECTQEIISLYEVLEGYNEKMVKEQLARFARQR